MWSDWVRQVLQSQVVLIEAKLQYGESEDHQTGMQNAWAPNIFSLRPILAFWENIVTILSRLVCRAARLM